MTWQLAPVIGSQNVNKAVDYYCNVLGFTCPNGVFQGAGDEGGVYGIIERDGIQLHIQIRRRDFQGDRDHIESDIYFYVGDAESLCEEFRAAGGNIIREPMDGPNYELRDFVLGDPDGNRLIFGSAKKPA